MNIFRLLALISLISINFYNFAMHESERAKIRREFEQRAQNEAAQSRAAAAEQHWECSICLEKDRNSRLSRLNCNHEFHHDCIDKVPNKQKCPNCMQPMSQEDIDRPIQPVQVAQKKAEAQGEACVICRDQFEGDSACVIFNCDGNQHKTHLFCAHHWIIKNRNNPTCPICRLRVANNYRITGQARDRQEENYIRELREVLDSEATKDRYVLENKRRVKNKNKNQNSTNTKFWASETIMAFVLGLISKKLYSSGMLSNSNKKNRKKGFGILITSFILGNSIMSQINPDRDEKQEELTGCWLFGLAAGLILPEFFKSKENKK